jgi:oxaloacetate decarboxylase gamma subunit
LPDAGTFRGDEIAVEVTDLLMDSLRLLVVGMAIVFAFLLLLVGVMRAMSAAVMRLAGDAGEGELIAVITAAVARFRRDRR